MCCKIDMAWDLVVMSADTGHVVLGPWDLAVLVDYAAACMDINFVPATWFLGPMACRLPLLA